MPAGSPLEALARRDRVWVAAGLAGTTLLAWVYLLRMAGDMARMDDARDAMTAAMMTARVAPWTGTDFVLMFLMWVIMMVAMMLPSAAPLILLFALVNRRKAGQGHPATPTATFAAGYLIAWTGFSLVATLLQWTLQRTGLLSSMMATTSTTLGGATLVAAGVYQWTPLKKSCLRHCQSPLQFVLRHWRDGTAGALVMGCHHGLYCLGCCWILMSLLFVGGVMNLVWIAGLSVFVLVEKLSRQPWVPPLSGTALVLWGAWVLTGGR